MSSNAQKLKSIMDRNSNSNNNNSNVTDANKDDDLRSLLSSPSSGDKGSYSNSKNDKGSAPGSPSKQKLHESSPSSLSDEISLSSLLGVGEPKKGHPHHPTGTSSQQGHHIVHLKATPSSWHENHPPNNSSDSDDITTSSSSPQHAHQHHQPTMTRRKKLLLILGTIILCMGLVGPSGILWTLFDEDDGKNHHEDDYYNTIDHHHNNNDYSSLRKKLFFNNNNNKDNGMTKTKQQHLLPNGDINNIDGNVWLLREKQQQRNDNSNGNMKKPRNSNQDGEQWMTKKRTGGGSSSNNSNRGIHSNIKEAIDNIDKVFLDEHPTYYNEEVAKKKQQLRDTAARRRKKKKEKRLEDEERVGNFFGGIKNKNNDYDDEEEEKTGIGGGGGGGGGSNRNNNNDALDEEDDDTFFMMEDANENILPIIHVDDNSLPENADALDTYTNSLPASEALECRASVVAFVINATDVKDECDGLRKAFDKTCSVQHSLNGGGGGGDGKGTTGESNNALRRRWRRRLQERGKPRLSNLLSAALQRELLSVRVTFMSRMRRLRQWQWGDGTSENETFKKQEEEWIVTEMGVYRRLSSRMEVEERRNQEEEEKGQSVAEAIEGVPHAHQKKEEQPPIISLNIPTAEKHISEETLNDALLLQDSKAETSVDQQQQPLTQETMEGVDGADAQTVHEGIATNAEAAVAAKDAAESAEAIRTATDAVKNIMSDPKSVEARTCCASILSVFHEHCDPTTTGVEDYSDRRLLVVVFVITVCGMVKSIIRHLNIRWLPEAGGCILVGVLGYVILSQMPHVQFAFDGVMFLRIMVPPIVFEAAVKINKQSFRRHAIPITLFAIIGTLASTAFTALILHKGSMMLNCTTIPIKESLIFGALISSIDPIAVLSVLNNMGMTDSDTIYVLIFGESLLNDGIAIVLFQTLVQFLDETLVVDTEVIFDASMHFIVVAFGSLSVGTLSGASATIYFATMHGCQTPLVECIMFFCWAIIPYYICDMVEWSGIVAIVANGFVMDLFVVGQKRNNVDEEIDFLVNGTSNGNNRARNSNRQQCRSFFNYEGHLSDTANSHVHFVIEIFATLMETAIFAYLGLFLFSSRYHWSAYLTIISIFATVMGRVIMIPTLSHLANVFNRMRGQRNRASTPRGEINEGVHIDRRMQIVLIFAGLRGAMSFALVEYIPMFDTTTGQGSRLKPELKSMTSAAVIFTVFVLGGATSYLLERLGYTYTKEHSAVEIAPLMQRNKKVTPSQGRPGALPSVRGIGSIRQRAQPSR